MKLKLPKIGLPILRLAKFGLPKIALPKGRQLLIGGSALALLGAGGLAFSFVRPMLGAFEGASPGDRAGDGESCSGEGVAGSGVARAERTEGGAGRQVGGRTEKDRSRRRSPKACRKQAPRIKAKSNTPEANTLEAHKADPKVQDAKPEQKAESKEEKAEKGEKGEKAEKEEKASAPLPLPPPPSEVERLIRRMQDIQERVATGDAAAYARDAGLLHMMGQKFADAPQETWASKQNARALVLYLLSGGGSTLGRTILNQHKFAPSEEPLAKAAVAYLEGVEGPDRDFLLSLDPRELDLDLGAQVAFVQSILLTSVDRPKALADLDLARLLAPAAWSRKPPCVARWRC